MGRIGQVALQGRRGLRTRIIWSVRDYLKAARAAAGLAPMTTAAPATVGSALEAAMMYARPSLLPAVTTPAAVTDAISASDDRQVTDLSTWPASALTPAVKV